MLFVIVFSLVMSVLVVFGVAKGLHYFLEDYPKQREAARIAKLPDNTLAALAIELLQRGEDWKIERYYAHHPDGISIWIANEDYGLKLKFDDREQSLTDLDRKRVWKAFTDYRDKGSPSDALLLAQRMVKRYEKTVDESIKNP